MAGDVFDAIALHDSDALQRFVDADPSCATNAADGGQTPLHFAACLNDTEAIDILLEAGADPEARNDKTRTPLHLAAHSNACDAITVLLSRGADIKATTRGGLSVAHFAAASGHAEALDLLIRRGAAVNGVGSGGYTPLHMAALANNADGVRALLKAGADPQIRDRKGHTPAEVARSAEIRTLLPMPKPVAPAATAAMPDAAAPRPAQAGSAPEASASTSGAPAPAPAATCRFESRAPFFHNPAIPPSERYARFVQNPATRSLPDASFYNGPTDSQGRPHGFGVLAVNNRGERYEGHFRHGVKEGEGVYHYANGNMIDCVFEDNAPNGQGKFYFANGGSISGTWRNGVIWEGSGVIISDKGAHYFARWNGGNLTESRLLD